MVFLKSIVFGLTTAFLVAFFWIGGEVAFASHPVPTAATVAAASPPPPAPSGSEDFRATTTEEIVSSHVESTRTYWPIAWCAGLIAGFWWMFRRQRLASSRFS